MKFKDSLIRLFTVSGLLFAGSLAALADNTMSIPTVFIRPLGEVTVPVVLNTDERVTSLEFVLTAPSNVNVKEVKYNAERINPQKHYFEYNKTTGKVLVSQLNSGANFNYLKGTEGAVVYVTLEATDAFDGDDLLTVSNIVVSSAGTKVPFQFEYGDNWFTVPVTSTRVLYGIAEEEVLVEAGKPTTFNMLVQNSRDIEGMSLNVSLPAGMSIVEQEEYDDWEECYITSLCINRTDRVPMGMQVASNKLSDGSYNVAITRIFGVDTNNSIEVSDDPAAVLSFDVVMDEEPAQDAVITIGSVKAATKNGTLTIYAKTFGDEETAVVPVKSANAVAVAGVKAATSAAAYDVAGRRTTTSRPGLYIVDGKKYIVK